MGRRALRKISPSLDLSRNYLDGDSLPHPFRADELFGRSAPFEIEVGCGKGLFLATAATSHPDQDYLGIEVSRKYARFAAARLAKGSLDNAKVLCGDALRFFRELLPDVSATAVHVYFPDPWWKKRHKKRRVLTGSFLADVERVLKPSGRLHFWTDVEEYFETTLALLRSATSLQGPVPVEERPAEHDLDYRTHFERRTRLHSQPVYRAEFIKRD